MKQLRNKKGFTLIELVVVIVILGILMMIVIPRVGTYQESAQTKACEGNMRTLSSSQAVYFASKNAYAGSAQDLIDEDLIPANIQCPGDSGSGPTDYSVTSDPFVWSCTADSTNHIAPNAP